MLSHTRPSDRAALVGIIDPATQSAGVPANTAWTAAKDFGSFLIMGVVGAVSATGTVDLAVYQATDASGTGAKAVTGKAITQLGASDDNKQALINLRADELDIANDFTHFRVTYTPTTADSVATVAVLGLDPRYAPASDQDLASVVEIVA